LFSSVSTRKNIIQAGKKSIASFEDSSTKYFPTSIQFVLTPDELYEKKYKIFFHDTIDESIRGSYGNLHRVKRQHQQ
jgi:hypothetical protein